MNLKEISEITKKLETLSCSNEKTNQCSTNTSSDDASVEQLSREIGTYGFARKYKNKLTSFEVQ